MLSVRHDAVGRARDVRVGGRPDEVLEEVVATLPLEPCAKATADRTREVQRFDRGVPVSVAHVVVLVLGVVLG